MDDGLAPALTTNEIRKAGVTAAQVRRWRDDPRVCAREVFKVEPDFWQDKFLAALGGPHLDPLAKPRMALKACKGPGKSFILGVAGWWWMLTRRHACGVVMSITGDNLKQNLWKEFALIQSRSGLLSHFFAVRGERIEAKEHSKTWFLLSRSFPQDADRAQQANTIAGLHGKHPLVICDEVGDYPDGVVVAAEAIFMNPVDARLIIAGNPTSTEGPLYRVQGNPRWWNYSITGDPDSPECASRVDKEESRQLIAEWGRDHDYVKINVLGLFPSQQSNKLLSPDQVQSASERKPDPNSYNLYEEIHGLDIARFGDNESVLFRRRGTATWNPRVWRQVDSMTLADQVAQEYLQHRPRALFADNGGVGGPVIDRLRQLGIPVIAVDFGGTPMESRYFDRRAEMYYRLAGWVKGGGCLPNDVQLRADLTTPNFSYVRSGKQTKFRLESKDDMRKRGVTSPDRGDALALTFALPDSSIPMRADVIMEKARNGELSEDALAQWQPPPSMTGRFVGGTEPDWDPFAGGG